MKKKLVSILIILAIFIGSGALMFGQNWEEKHFTYYQKSGILEVKIDFSDGSSKMKYFYAFSGSGKGKNNPSYENVPNKGPVPQGNYTMDIRPDGYTRPDGTFFGGPVILLIPDKKTKEKIESYNRGVYDFIIHGGTKSAGCIILNKTEIDGAYELYNRLDLYRIIEFYGINKLEVKSGNY
jgi:hypothetical protein